MGGSSNSAQREATEAERQRQDRIAAATRRIDTIYNKPSRQRQYGDFVSAVRDYYMQDADRQKSIADRNLKFSMARAGLTGGSASVDSGKTLGDEYRRGILSAEQHAQSSLADLMSQDNQSRLNLIQLANSGTDVTSVASNAAASMRASLEGAKSSAVANGLGDIFGASADIYKRQQEAAEKRRQQVAALGSNYGNPFSK